jgi:hypothetical protein
MAPAASFILPLAFSDILLLRGFGLRSPTTNFTVDTQNTC